MDQKPTVGRIVHYYPTRQEKDAIKDAGNGNHDAAPLPAVIVRVWSDTCVNLKVLADAHNDYWATSRQHASVYGPGQVALGGYWEWPSRS